MCSRLLGFEGNNIETYFYATEGVEISARMLKRVLFRHLSPMQSWWKLRLTPTLRVYASEWR